MHGGKGRFITNPPTIVKVGSQWPILMNFVEIQGEYREESSTNSLLIRQSIDQIHTVLHLLSLVVDLVCS